MLAVGESWTCVVLGKAAGAGSKTIRELPGGKRAVRPSSKFTKPWQTKVKATAQGQWPEGVEPLDCPVEATCVFYFEQPKYVKDGDEYPLKSGGDLDKLIRAAIDPLKGIAITDDRRIVRIIAERRFGSPERAEITLTRLPKTRREGLHDAWQRIRELLGFPKEPEEVLYEFVTEELRLPV
jgi:Holliday junction resolvase RusA-like endonuclease